MRIVSFQDYKRKLLIWKKHPSDQRYWMSSVGNQTLYLRMNNFPEEPLYTLISSTVIENFDDLPSQWILE